jgi:MFS family permease
LTAGNLSTAQAYISDHTKPENRAKAFGIIGIAFGIGFMFGPALAGWLQEYGLHWPFVVAAVMSAGSMVCSYTLLEPGVTATQSAASPAAPGGKRPAVFDLAVYLEYFRRPGLGSLYLQFFLFTFSFSAFMGGFALFARSQVGFLFTYSGFLGIILQGGLIGRLVKRFGEPQLAVAAFAAIVVADVVLGFTMVLPLLIAVTTVSAFGNGVARPVLTSEITQQVGRHEQGVAIGISGSLSSLAMTMAPPSGGSLLDHDWLVAWTLVPATAAVLGLAAALVSRAKNRAPASQPAPTSQPM